MNILWGKVLGSCIHRLRNAHGQQHVTWPDDPPQEKHYIESPVEC